MRRVTGGRPAGVQSESDERLRWVAALGLGNASTASDTRPGLGASEFRPFLESVERHRLLGALARAVADGSFVVTDEQRREVAEQHRAWLRHALVVERRLSELGRLYGAAGIDFRVLKGVALAHLVYDDPSDRVFGDLDILVPSTRFGDAVRIAQEALGGRRPVPELRRGFDREFEKEALIRVDDVEVDIHRMFVRGALGLRIELDELFASPDRFAVGGQAFLALSPLMRFMHACYNAVLGDIPPRLGSVRDVVMTARAVQADAAKIVAIATRWRAVAVIQSAASMAVDLLGVRDDPLLRDLASIEPPAYDRLLLRSYLSPAGRYSAPLAALLTIPGIGGRARYAYALLNPSATYLSARGWTWRSHARRAMRSLFRHG